MFDDFDHRRRLESAEPAVAIHQRTVHQANTFALLRRQPIELKARFRQIEYSSGHIHADNLSELVIGQETAQKLALASDTGTLWFLLRPAGDAKNAPKKSITSAELLAQINGQK